MAKKTKTQLVDSARRFVIENIDPLFHEKLLLGLRELKLRKLLEQKNPYLFKAKAIQQACMLVTKLLDAYLSSKEETIFGNFLEALAIHVCKQAYGGKKSTTEGIDLEFERDSIRYIVSIKSGPKWGNSSQIKRMESNFAQARRIAGKVSFSAICGCCYGRENQSEKGHYRKLCGQDFWELITGLDDFYLKMIEPLGADAKKRTEEFDEKYAAVVNQFSKEFIQEYCHDNGMIDWEKLVAFNSSRLVKK